MSEPVSNRPLTNRPLKAQQIFEQAPADDVCEPMDEHTCSFKSQVIFDQALEQQLENASSDGSDVDEQSNNTLLQSIHGHDIDSLVDDKTTDEIELNPKKSSSGKLFKWFLVIFAAICAIETGEFLLQSWLNSPFMAALYTGALGLGLAVAGKTLIAEIKQLRRLKQVGRWQKDCQRMEDAEQIGQARTMCSQISQSLPASAQQSLVTFEQSIRDDFSDDDIVHLYSEMVLSPIDEKAVKVISRHASETSLMVAISPMAVMDMALMMWRNFKMIEQICSLYGVELGYWSRIKLTKTVFKNVAYAGVSELIADIGAAALSMELAGKMSSRAAQGLGAGLLTGRLGFQVMQLCRPIPAPKEKQKRLGDLSKHLLGNIRRALTGAELK